MVEAHPFSPCLYFAVLSRAGGQEVDKLKCSVTTDVGSMDMPMPWHVYGKV